MKQDYTGFTENKIAEIKKYEENYLIKHGHRIGDEKAKINCPVCQAQFQKIWNGIANEF